MNTRSYLLRKLLLIAVLLVPLARLGWLAHVDDMGANPVEFVIHDLGHWTLIMLLLTLAISPWCKLTGWNAAMRYRRTLGLTTSFYVCLHFLAYAGLDQWFDLQAITHDVIKHPYVLVGALAFLLMVPLAITSTDRMMRRLGRSWRTLHRTIYLIAVLGVLHFWWLVKRDITEPLIYTLILCVLLALRTDVFLRWSLLLRGRVATHR